MELNQSLLQLHHFIYDRLQQYFNVENPEVVPDQFSLEAPRYNFPDLTLNTSEYLMLLLAIAPHLRPGFLDAVVQEFLPQGGEFPEFGGVKNGNHRGMVPTGETAMFLFAGEDWNKRSELMSIFSNDHFFASQNILRIEETKEGEPKMSGRILISNEWLESLLTGKVQKPRFGPDFPAKLIETKMEWEDAVLHPQTSHQISMIEKWLEHNHELMKDENLNKKIKKGYRVLFYGPPGTGKTLVSSLIGKKFNRDVYRIDLSQIVSKYIGETEKNLEKVFAKAENKDWILFFDEADALFGKRTGVQSSHDKYANQEISYLLQRVEDFSGLLILASNLKNNIDQAFLRRFHQIIHFPFPDASERLSLWQKALPASISLHPDINLQQLAQKYEITGASIINVVHYASLLSLGRKNRQIMPDDFVDGIRQELMKEEKAV